MSPQSLATLDDFVRGRRQSAPGRLVAFYKARIHRQTLLGNVATAVAVMAVAAVGFMMLTGRMNWRFGATVILGCFILFGASAIVSGIQAASAG